MIFFISLLQKENKLIKAIIAKVEFKQIFKLKKKFKIIFKQANEKNPLNDIYKYLKQKLMLGFTGKQTFENIASLIRPIIDFAEDGEEPTQMVLYDFAIGYVLIEFCSILWLSVLNFDPLALILVPFH